MIPVVGVGAIVAVVSVGAVVPAVSVGSVVAVVVSVVGTTDRIARR
ncbi:hypothetical protein [Halostella salina]|nr:hypothetical protein [Halostella salina]